MCNLSRLLLGALVLTSSTIVLAASVAHPQISKQPQVNMKSTRTLDASASARGRAPEEAVAAKSIRIPDAPVVAPGTRLYVDGKEKNDFYILGEKDPDPVTVVKVNKTDKTEKTDKATDKTDEIKAQMNKDANKVDADKNNNVNQTTGAENRAAPKLGFKAKKTKTFHMVANKNHVAKIKHGLHATRGVMGKHLHPRKFASRHHKRYVG